MFKLAVFSDEISQDLDLAITVAKEYQCQALEIRSVWDTPVQEMSDQQAADIKHRCDDQGLAICAVASPFYKCELDDAAAISQHHDYLKRFCELAHLWETDLIRGFTFWRRGPVEPLWAQILEQFETPIEILEKANCRMVIENEAATYIGTGAMTARFLEELGSPNVAICWDPCNVLFDFDYEEKPFPDGYQAIKNHMLHMHLKDAERTGDKQAHCVRIGEGQVGFKQHITALIEDNYQGYLSLETHWRPVDITQEMMDRPGGAAYSNNAEQASRLCLQSIHAILNEIRAV